MKTAWIASALIIFGAFVVGCGGDACDDAADKLEECGFSGGDGGDADAECTEQAECVSNCIVDAECDDITSPTADSAYTKCLAGCA
jgi:hypothetical protein